MIYVIYQKETDGDIIIRAYQDLFNLTYYMNRLGLTDSDYAVIDGNLIKSFDTKL